jgi:DNA mismatch repair protein MutS
MRQYYAVKEKHPDKILFFRMGDFYEMFGDDAVKAAPILGIALTSRSHGGPERLPLAGVPYHSADKYLARLLEHGEKVVVVEQVEDPRSAKGLVKREIVEILTPGTATVDGIEEKQRPVWLSLGLAALDLSVGAFMIDEGPEDEIAERLKVLEPSEILLPSASDGQADHAVAEALGLSNGAAQLTAFEPWNFDYRTAARELNEHFGTTTLDGFGVAGNRLAVAAAGAVFRYLRENQRDHLAHITRLSRFAADDFMLLDYSTVRNLELLKSIATGSQQYSLFCVMNRCHTSAGSRRLQNALLGPFKNKAGIELRQSGVAELVKNRELAYTIRELTKGLPDLEKLAGRLGLGKLGPRQMAGIKEALAASRRIKATLVEAHSPLLRQIATALPECEELIGRLDRALIDDPPLTANKGGIFRPGYSSELDTLNGSIREARQYIGSLQQVERERTGIGSLKVGLTLCRTVTSASRRWSTPSGSSLRN